jgi:phytoene dehydrogenase-like protein
MSSQYDVIIIGAGLGGLTAAARLAQAGCRTLLVERNTSVGGAASTYKAGELIIEASLHETSGPEDPADPKHAVLKDLGVLDKVVWVPTGSVYEVRGGPLGVPFVLPDGFGAAKDAFADRFPTLRSEAAAILSEMEDIATGLGTLSRGAGMIDDPLSGLAALPKLAGVARGWHRTVSQRLQMAFGDNEVAKCALAANLLYWHDDPDALWWVLFAVAQGGYIGSGGRYVQGGSQRLSNALAKAFRSAGGELLLRRRVSEILVDDHGRPYGIAHVAKDGSGRVEAHAGVIVGNAAPTVVAEMLPQPVREKFFAPYASQALSISLFSATIGLSEPPQNLGLASYATMLLPEWMRTLSDYKRGAEIMAGAPGEAMPPIAVVNYAAIESGIEGAPYPVSVVGADRIENWQGLGVEDYEAKRVLWRSALIAALDRAYPGFAESVVTSVFSTPVTMNSYLGTPAGAVYGFAPLPPQGHIWGGTGRSPKTAVEGLYLASAFAGCGGYTGAILGGAAAARQILAALPADRTPVSKK